MIETPTVELEGYALDYAVAVAEGWIWQSNHWADFWGRRYRFIKKDNKGTLVREFGELLFSQDLELSSTIIDCHCIGTIKTTNGKWIANSYDASINNVPGNTRCIAAMRCYVLSKLGTTVVIPNTIFHKKDGT